MSAIAWSIRGDVKDIFLPRPEVEKVSLIFQPLSAMRGVRFCLFAL